MENNRIKLTAIEALEVEHERRGNALAVTKAIMEKVDNSLIDFSTIERVMKEDKFYHELINTSENTIVLYENYNNVQDEIVDFKEIYLNPCIDYIAISIKGGVASIDISVANAVSSTPIDECIIEDKVMFAIENMLTIEIEDLAYRYEIKVSTVK